MSRWTFPLGTLRHDGWDVVVDDALDGWQHTGLLVVDLTAGDERRFTTATREAVVLPLSGGATVTVTGPYGDLMADLAPRASVFAGAPDVVYAPRGSDVVVSATAGPTRVALCLAVVPGEAPDDVPPPRHLPAADVPVELRGAGQASREVRNFGVPGVLGAERIIACEVVTPEGNWSSYPPHKHDEERPDEETALEEIYYHEVRVTPGSPAPGPNGEGADPHGYLRVYGSGADREIDELTPVRTGDVVLVPHGWHGPAMAVPGYDLYYLNVMAGPGPERAWLICDDPAHGWVRSTWADQPVDPRLPLGGPR
ncbi:5-deoxy-glucuronate isomerase [Lapillicoccus jejuensis]|uniref:5-deoxyglucuronate isomerase n=1 Tax=Lapillicoccus jejuensis TaxID=402171 RepID=A0A542E5C0_9MICO|nr:5-deoxy-glucuronate isomerase [Lapillicoccus jejuensis]TQJ10531.1 5-deoxyglucuronate isomerase [Lapillicoccus jejuensis]